MQQQQQQQLPSLCRCSPPDGVRHDLGLSVGNQHNNSGLLIVRVLIMDGRGAAWLENQAQLSVLPNKPSRDHTSRVDNRRSNITTEGNPAIDNIRQTHR
ncbi:hypothetical protein PoB_001528000 [Plakobranchus ocellatus]|uniref:Uncharacterized protein n=1 Tax=Plakobranchus ocellatus TaxID=259542 RepID=A0AAV3Z029_9GAST|nr:hypothetical protein PoB_001528000 [Plakobranchus ocellatus]